jgi:hypothetical protein
MADSTIANALAETSVTGGNDDDPVDVLWRNVQHLLCQAEKDWQTIQMYQGKCDKLEDKCINMETIRKMTQHKLEVAWRRHYSDRAKIQELRHELEVERAEKPLKMKSRAEPPRPSLSAKKPVLEETDADILEDTEDAAAILKRWREHVRARNAAWKKTAKGQALDARHNAQKKMKRILELQGRGNGATLDQLREVFMQRCKSSASRDALARLLAASGGSVGASASASGSSDASSVPSPAAAARRKGSTLQWPGDVPADAEGEPPSKKMKLAGPSEDDNQK